MADFKLKELEKSFELFYKTQLNKILKLDDIEWNEFQHKVVEQVHGFDRSRISPNFAKNFVELFLEE